MSALLNHRTALLQLYIIWWSKPFPTLFNIGQAVGLPQYTWKSRGILRLGIRRGPRARGGCNSTLGCMPACWTRAAAIPYKYEAILPYVLVLYAGSALYIITPKVRVRVLRTGINNITLQAVRNAGEKEGGVRFGCCQSVDSTSLTCHISTSHALDDSLLFFLDATYLGPMRDASMLRSLGTYLQSSLFPYSWVSLRSLLTLLTSHTPSF